MSDNVAALDQGFAALIEYGIHVGKMYLNLVRDGVPPDHALALTQTMITAVALQTRGFDGGERG